MVEVKMAMDTSDVDAEAANWIEERVNVIMNHDDVIDLAKFREIFDLKQVC